MDRPGLCWTFLVGITKFIIFLKTALFYLTVIVSSFVLFSIKKGEQKLPGKDRNMIKIKSF